MSMWICFGILGMLTVCLTVNQIVVLTKVKRTEEKIDSCNARCEVIRDDMQGNMNYVHDRFRSLGNKVDEHLKQSEEDDEMCDILDDIEDMIEDLQDEMDENESVDNAYGEALKSFSAKIDEIQETLDKVLKDISEMKR